MMDPEKTFFWTHVSYIFPIAQIFIFVSLKRIK